MGGHSGEMNRHVGPPDLGVGKFCGGHRPPLQ
jgi:hypothetical protein